MYSDPVQVLLTYRRLQTKRMTESLLEKLKKFYIKLLQHRNTEQKDSYKEVEIAEVMYGKDTQSNHKLV